MNRYKRLQRCVAWLALPLGILAIVALWRPDVLRSDYVDVPSPSLGAQEERPAIWASSVDEDFRLGSTPFPRTVIKQLRAFDPAQQLYVAS